MSGEQVIPDFLRKAAVASAEAGRHIEIAAQVVVSVDNGVVSDPVVVATPEPIAVVAQKPPVSKEAKPARKRTAAKPRAAKASKVAPASVAQAPDVVSDPVIAVTPSPEEVDYTSGGVFAEQILAEQDAAKDISSKAEEIHQTKVDAEQLIGNKDKAKKKEQTPEEIEIARIESEMKELYHTMIDEKSGKVIESGKLIDARKAYAEAEYRNVGVWQRLTEKLGVRKKESDSVAERGKYNQVLQKLITLRIEKLKNQGLSPEDLKKAMAEELQFFGMESKVKLYEAWTQATMKRESFPAKAVGLCEDLGNKYNKLPLWQKLGLGALAIGASVATGGGAAAMGLVAARRVAAGLGTFTMTEGVLEKISQGRASNVVKNKADQSIAEMKDGDAEKQLKQLMKTLKGEMTKDNLRQELHDRAKGKSLRTITAAAVSFGAMFGIPAAANHIKDVYFGTEVVEAAKNVGVGGASGVKEALPSVKVAPPSAAAFVESPNPVAESPAVVGPYTPLEEPPMAAAEASASVPAVYEIVKGDNTWKILDGYLTDHDPKFAGMSDGQRTHAIDALKDKLKLLTPAQLKEAGFTSGNIDKLRVGDEINLDKLLGAVDADKAIGNADNISADAVKNIEANNAKIAEWMTAHPGEALNDQVIDEKILGKGGISGAGVHVRGTMPELLNSFDDASADRLLNHPPVSPVEIAPSPSEATFEKLTPVEMRRGSDWFMQIFRVEDQASGKDWIFDKKEILGTKMSDILKVEANGVVSVKENVNFNPAQSKNLQEFTSELPKVFPGGRAALSDFLRARPNISVGEYIARVAKAVPQGTRIGLYTTTN